jgi:hypothetical protein
MFSLLLKLFLLINILPIQATTTSSEVKRQLPHITTFNGLKYDATTDLDVDIKNEIDHQVHNVEVHAAYNDPTTPAPHTPDADKTAIQGLLATLEDTLNTAKEYFGYNPTRPPLNAAMTYNPHVQTVEIVGNKANDGNLKKRNLRGRN